METLTPKIILVPTDFSAPAAHALRYAAALGERFGAHLLVIYADLFSPPVDYTIGGAGTFHLPQEDMIEAAREQLQAFAETNINTGVPCNVRVVLDTPISAILAQVRKSGANLIVMGTHGRTGLRRLLFGSVTEAVLNVAPVPVIAVHEDTPEVAPMHVIAGNQSTEVGRAAMQYAAILAGGGKPRFIEVPEGDDLILRARSEGADLIALGVSAERHREERIVQHSNCAVLVVNALAARAQSARKLAVPAA